MKILKLFIFLSLLTMFFFSIANDLATIGQLWQKFNVNSLIGFQKIIETINPLYIFNINLWQSIFIPFLKLEFLLVFSLINLFIFLVFSIKLNKKL